MKSVIAAVPLVALFTTGTLAQWLPSCAWNDCLNSWQQSSCTSSSGWDCVCGNSTAVAQINTCVATSCSNTTDQEAIYGAIAQLCANNGVTVTNSQQATFSATSGGSLLPTITGAPRGGWGPGGQWHSGDWSSWISACSTAIGSAPSGWSSGGWGNWHSGGPGGPGGFGGQGGPWGGPWGTKASGINCNAWTTWTAGWGPFSSWTGTWSGCSSTTATPSPATVTTTVTSNGQVAVITGTTFGVQAQAVATTGSANAGGAAAPTDSRALGIYGGAAAAVFGLMVAL